MAETSKPTEKIKGLDGSVSEPVSNSLTSEPVSQEALPLRPKGRNDVLPPGQTLTGKQEHCMYELLDHTLWNA